MNFDIFLEGKMYAYSKDGVRKQIRDAHEGAEWRNTIANPPKTKAPKKDDYDLGKIGRIIQDTVANYFPDSDGWDAAAKRVITLYPHLTVDSVGVVLDKGAKKHLGVKSYHAYVEQMHRDHGHAI